jgi:chromatin remodeling complex protein RSC6
MSGKGAAASELIVALQNQFRDKVGDGVQRFLSKVDKRRLGDSTMGTASTNLIMSMNKAGNWYAASLEKAIRKEMKEIDVEKKKNKAPRAPNPALTRKYILSDGLSEFMGTRSASRQDVLKRVWEHANANGLKDPNHPGKVKVDYSLRPVLGSGDSDGFVRNTEIMKLISNHIHGPAE